MLLLPLPPPGNKLKTAPAREGSSLLLFRERGGWGWSPYCSVERQNLQSELQNLLSVLISLRPQPWSSPQSIFDPDAMDLFLSETPRPPHPLTLMEEKERRPLLHWHCPPSALSTEHVGMPSHPNGSAEEGHISATSCHPWPTPL